MIQLLETVKNGGDQLRGSSSTSGAGGMAGVGGIGSHGHQHHHHHGHHHHHPPISPRKGPSRMHDMQWNKAMQVERNLGAGVDEASHRMDVSMAANFSSHPSGDSTSIPRFYPYTKDALRFTEERVNGRILEFLRPFGEGLPLVALKTLLRELFGLPVSLGFALHRKLASLSENVISVRKLLDWMERTGFARSSAEKQFYEVLKEEEGEWITHEDLRPVILGIIVSHPGLVFLKVRFV